MLPPILLFPEKPDQHPSDFESRIRFRWGMSSLVRRPVWALNTMLLCLSLAPNAVKAANCPERGDPAGAVHQTASARWRAPPGADSLRQRNPIQTLTGSLANGSRIGDGYRQGDIPYCLPEIRRAHLDTGGFAGVALVMFARNSAQRFRQVSWRVCQSC